MLWVTSKPRLSRRSRIELLVSRTRTSEGTVAFGGFASTKGVATWSAEAPPLLWQPWISRRWPDPTHVCAISLEPKLSELVIARLVRASNTAKSQLPRAAELRTVTKPDMGAR